MTLTPERRAEIRDRVDATPRGPWHTEYFGDAGYPQRIANDAAILIADTHEGGTGLRPIPEFIAHARTDVPDLLAEVDRLTADRDSWKNATDATGLALGEVNRQRGEAQDRANAAEAEVARLTSALDRAEAERDTIMDGLIRLHSVVTPIEQTNAAVAMVMSATTTLLRKHGVFGRDVDLGTKFDERVIAYWENAWFLQVIRCRRPQMTAYWTRRYAGLEPQDPSVYTPKRRPT